MRTSWSQEKGHDYDKREVTKFAYFPVTQLSGRKERTIWLETYISLQSYDEVYDCWDEVNVRPIK